MAYLRPLWHLWYPVVPVAALRREHRRDRAQQKKTASWRRNGCNMLYLRIIYIELSN